MNKDYLESRKYPSEVLDNFDISYYFRDSCVNHYCDYVKCKEASSIFTDNFLYNTFKYKKSCKKMYNIWTTCQKQRESEIESKLAEYLREKRLR